MFAVSPFRPWLRLNYRLIGRGWSLLEFWALVALSGIGIFTLGFILPLFQSMYPRNAGNAATYTVTLLLYSYLVLCYLVFRLVRRTDWHRGVLVRFSHMPRYALAFFVLEPGLLMLAGFYLLGLAVGFAAFFPVGQALAAIGLTLLVLVGLFALLFAAWCRWGGRLQGRHELLQLVLIGGWLLILPNIAANWLPAVRAFVAWLLSLSRYVPLAGSYGEAMAAMLSGAPVLTPILWLLGHTAAALLIAGWASRG
ncbi:hypothetical protein [Rhodothermus profundi]|uniref:Uncharacterized protein n=1 Tax=Rhodothermus profundi TaxID=633813 RepID=A0A1M6TJ47_9BACT|nr:hypothetical protein [Rhodothermus profundi]SHK56950.1 hypothetical protein SAMN04488087_1417 [Rhodothermus profundi]